MGNDLYILFAVGIVFILGITATYFWYNKFEIAVFFFGLSPLVSAIFFDNLPPDNLISDTEATVGIGSYLRAAILITLGVIGLLKFIANHKKNNLKIPIHFVLFGVFIAFSMFSIFYTLDPKFTLIRTTLLFSVFCFLLGLHQWLMEDDNLTKALNSLFILVTAILIITFIGIFAFPSRVWWYKLPRLVGIWEHPNTFGSFCMLSYPILLWKFYKTQGNKKYYVIILILLNFGMHVLTGSRTTLLASTVGVFIWLLLERNWVKLFAVSILVGMTIILVLVASPTSFKREDTSDITDLSSRGEIWQSAMIFIKEKPFIGYGFGVEGKIFQDETMVDLEGSFIERNVRQSLHNGYFSVLVGGGIIGLTIWLIVLLLPVILAFPSSYSPEKAYAIFTVVAVLITNFVESALTGSSLPSDIFFWLAWVILGVIWYSNKNLKKINKTF